MKDKANILKSLIISGLLVGGIGGVILLQGPDELVLNVNEWRTLVSIYDREIKLNGGMTLPDNTSMKELLNEVDKKILNRVQNIQDIPVNQRQDAIQYRNLVEGLLIKRNADNKDVIRKLR